MLTYRIILVILIPAVALRMLVDLIRGKESLEGLRQRLGFAERNTAAPHPLWLHGASLGELTAARPLVDRLLRDNPDLNIIVTCNSYTARSMVKDWQIPRIVVMLAPLDSPTIVARFLTRTVPFAAVNLENELWPIRTLACDNRGVPVLVIDGRMSSKTAEIWARFPELSRRVMGTIRHIAPLDKANKARFIALGLPNDRFTAPHGLKAQVVMPPPDNIELKQLRKIFPHDSTLLAASTHAGEEQVILDAFCSLHDTHPDIKLIIAPRHPNRAHEIAPLIKATELPWVQRSEGAGLDINKTIYLADTIQEMPLWYSLSCITIMGGSFVAKGGHAPLEPVQFGSLIVYGPDVKNHQNAYKSLGKKGLAYRAKDSQGLKQVLDLLLASMDHSRIDQQTKEFMLSASNENLEIIVCLQTIINQSSSNL